MKARIVSFVLVLLFAAGLGAMDRRRPFIPREDGLASPRESMRKPICPVCEEPVELDDECAPCPCCDGFIHTSCLGFTPKNQVEESDTPKDYRSSSQEHGFGDRYRKEQELQMRLRRKLIEETENRRAVERTVKKGACPCCEEKLDGFCAQCTYCKKLIVHFGCVSKLGDEKGVPTCSCCGTQAGQPEAFLEFNEYQGMQLPESSGHDFNRSFITDNVPSVRYERRTNWKEEMEKSRKMGRPGKHFSRDNFDPFARDFHSNGGGRRNALPGGVFNQQDFPGPHFSGGGGDSFLHNAGSAMRMRQSRRPKKLNLKETICGILDDFCNMGSFEEGITRVATRFGKENAAKLLYAVRSLILQSPFKEDAAMDRFVNAMVLIAMTELGFSFDTDLKDCGQEIDEIVGGYIKEKDLFSELKRGPLFLAFLSQAYRSLTIALEKGKRVYKKAIKFEIEVIESFLGKDLEEFLGELKDRVQAYTDQLLEEKKKMKKSSKEDEEEKK